MALLHVFVVRGSLPSRLFAVAWATQRCNMRQNHANSAAGQYGPLRLEAPE
jgi:hypothetical protein